MRPIDHIIFYKKPILLVSMILVLMTSLMLWNASDLKLEPGPQYAGLCHRRLSSQLTGDISCSDQRLRAVPGGCGGLSPLPPHRDTLEDFLADRAEILGLDALAVIGRTPQGFTEAYRRRPIP